MRRSAVRAEDTIIREVEVLVDTVPLRLRLPLSPADRTAGYCCRTPLSLDVQKSGRRRRRR